MADANNAKFQQRWRQGWNVCLTESFYNTNGKSFKRKHAPKGGHLMDR